MLDFNKAFTDKILLRLDLHQAAMNGLHALVEAAFTGETRAVVPYAFVANRLRVGLVHVHKGRVRFIAKDQKGALTWFGSDALTAEEVSQLLDLLRKKRYRFI